MNKKWSDDNGNEITEEYIIINKKTIQKRIEELEEIDGVITSHLVKELKQILSQSTPLIPEIEKAIKEGIKLGLCNSVIEQKHRFEDYISNLKLKI